MGGELDGEFRGDRDEFRFIEKFDWSEEQFSDYSSCVCC